MVGRILASVAAAALVAAPVTAAPNPASSLSVAKAQRAGAVTQHGSDAISGSYVIAFFVVIAIGLGLYAVIDGDDEPRSP